LNLEYEFYKLIFMSGSYPYARLGYAEALSKTGTTVIWDQWNYRHMCYCNNLFGSPHTEVWTNWPGTMQVTHPGQITCQVVTGGGGQSQQTDNPRPRQLTIFLPTVSADKNISVKFGIPAAGNAELILYNVIGTAVSRMVMHDLKPGYYYRRLDAHGIPGGIYVLMLRQDSAVVTKKIVVVR